MIGDQSCNTSRSMLTGGLQSSRFLLLMLEKPVDDHTDSVGTYSAAEMESALSFPPRTTELLLREGLLAPPVIKGKRGRDARHSDRMFCRAASASALVPVTSGNILPAMRLASQIAAPLEDNHFTMPFGMGDIVAELRRKRVDVDVTSLYAPGAERACPFRVIEAARKAHINVHDARRGDAVVVILDGTLVGARSWAGPDSMLADGGRHKIDPLLRITYPARGVLKAELIEEEGAEMHFIHRFQSAESLLFLNVSLTIRRAIAAVADHRRDADKR